ncbi:MAG TPA: erythromycin esterase family protein, partial [Chitinophagaceae bacterium]|nr:erythromycin esterase family protein [Chitinophagaceae bacterium]
MRKPVLTIALSSFSLFAFSQDELMIHSNLTKKIDVTDVHHYKIKTVKGDFYKLLVIQNGIDLIIEVKPGDSSEARSFDSPNGSSGPEPVEFIASVTGNTFIDVKPFVDSSNTKAGEYSIEYVEHVSAAEYSKMLKQKQKDEDDFVSWIQKTSVPLKSVKAGSGFDDLESLKPVLANKRVVAMGEATHGTKEFFQMKHRMLEFLVKEMGFTVFAIEASYSRCRYINDYVLNGKGDLDTATTIHGFTTWSTE